MKHYTIFGNPVEHSKSPQMHNAGFEYLHYDGEYTKTHLENGNELKEKFLANNIQGANITVPHKEIAFESADEIKGIAKKIGAVNTYINNDGKVTAYNTDAPGFMKAIEEFENIKTAIILGAGGTAKAIAIAFKDAGIKTIVLNRSESKLEFFESIGAKTYSWDNFSSERYDLVVNSTSAGLKDEEFPAPIEILDEILEDSTYAIDCIYGKVTPFLKQAEYHNLISKDGEDMLLYQGVIAFELFTGIKADTGLVEAMRKGLKES